MRTFFINLCLFTVISIVDCCTYSDLPKIFVGTWTFSDTQITCLGSNTINTPCSKECQYLVIAADGTYYINNFFNTLIVDKGTYTTSGNQISLVSLLDEYSLQYHIVGDKLVTSAYQTPSGCMCTLTYMRPK